MKLNEFVEGQIKILEVFEHEWIVSNENDPENFPMEMEEGEWLEMLAFANPDQ
jgi:hypothetical protein